MIQHAMMYPEQWHLINYGSDQNSGNSDKRHGQGGTNYNNNKKRKRYEIHYPVNNQIQ